MQSIERLGREEEGEDLQICTRRSRNATYQVILGLEGLAFSCLKMQIKKCQTNTCRATIVVVLFTYARWIPLWSFSPIRGLNSLHLVQFLQQSPKHYGLYQIIRGLWITISTHLAPHHWKHLSHQPVRFLIREATTKLNLYSCMTQIPVLKIVCPISYLQKIDIFAPLNSSVLPSYLQILCTQHRLAECL